MCKALHWRSVAHGTLLGVLTFSLWVACSYAGPARSVPVTRHAGKEWVELRRLADFYDLELRRTGEKKRCLVGARDRLEIEADTRAAKVNGIVVWLHYPPVLRRGRVMVRDVDFHRLIDPVMRGPAYLNARDFRVVVLDPGHGGTDRGARGARRHVEEKRVVLDVARRARNLLKAKGVRVYLTRDGDRALSLADRGRKAQQYGADAFVSIHLNAATRSAPHGIESFVLPVAGAPSTSGGEGEGAHPGNRFDHSSTALGYAVHRNLIERTGSEDRGLRRARFVVLEDAPCPATLVECGFVSNPLEEERFLDSAHRQRLADAIASGILAYFDQVKQARGARR